MAEAYEPKERFSARFEALKKYYKDHITEDMEAKLPVNLAQVLAAIDGLDRDMLVEHYRKEFQKQMADDLEIESFGGAVFEWFFDGGDLDMILLNGYAHEKCTLEGPGETDLTDVDKQFGIECDNPDTSGKEVYGGEVNLDPVMGPWYQTLRQSLVDHDFEELDKVEDFFGEDELEDVYAGLFEVTLFDILHDAYVKVTGDKPGIFYVGRHDRWPVLISKNI